MVPLKFSSKANKTDILALELLAEGPTIVLKITPFNQSKSKFIIDDKPHSAGFTIIEDPAAILQVLQIRLEGIGISFISKQKEEIAYLSIKQFVTIFTESEKDRQFNTSFQWIQIDNQMYGCLEPILLYPTVVSREKMNEDQPILLMTISQSKDVSHGVDYYHWFMMLIQEISLDIDEDFLYAAMDFFHFRSILPEQSKLCELSSLISFPKSTETSDRLYFERLFLQPVQINLSFSRIQRAKKDLVRPHSSSFMTFIYDVLTMTVGNISDAPIRCNALELEHPILSRSHLLERIIQFYYQEMLGQLHSIVGAADFLGNPVGLFNNVARF
jgi:vacuolar protein sorting-associated protein 13A/C